MALVSVSRSAVALLVLSGLLLVAPLAQADTIVHFDTNVGAFDVRLYDDAIIKTTVDNFISYVQSSAYVNSFFHRLDHTYEIIQGGGFKATDNLVTSATVSNVAADSATKIPLQYYFPNKRGTIGMARTTDPNSATSGFYFNMQDNSDIFGPSNTSPGYAVFGEVTDEAGLEVLEHMMSQEVWKANVALNSSMATLPLVNYTVGQALVRDNLEIIRSVTVVPPVGAQEAAMPEMGDFSGDGAIDQTDYVMWADNYGWTGPADQNPLRTNRTAVDQSDYARWLGNFSVGGGVGGGIVPEPASLGLLAAGALAMLRRRATR